MFVNTPFSTDLEITTDNLDNVLDLIDIHFLNEFDKCVENYKNNDFVEHLSDLAQIIDNHYFTLLDTIFSLKDVTYTSKSLKGISKDIYVRNKKLKEKQNSLYLRS